MTSTPKRSITIRLDTFTIDYFKGLAVETDLPYQTLINLYLRDCAGSGRRLALDWRLVGIARGAFMAPDSPTDEDLSNDE